MLKVNGVDNDGLTSACPRQAKVAPLKEAQLHSTKGMVTKEPAAIYLVEVRLHWRETQHTTTARWLIVLFKRGYRKSSFKYTRSSFLRCVFCSISTHCFSNSVLPLQLLNKQNLYLCSTKSPSVFGKSGLAASLIKGLIYRFGTRQKLGQIWLNWEGNIFFFFVLLLYLLLVMLVFGEM